MSAQKRTARGRVTRSASPRVVDGSSSVFLVVDRDMFGTLNIKDNLFWVLLVHCLCHVKFRSIRCILNYSSNCFPMCFR